MFLNQLITKPKPSLVVLNLVIYFLILLLNQVFFFGLEISIELGVVILIFDYQYF